MASTYVHKPSVFAVNGEQIRIAVHRYHCTRYILVVIRVVVAVRVSIILYAVYILEGCY